MADKIQICRLCLEENVFILSIFSPEAKKLNIQTHIEQYIQLKIDDNDPYTKYICYNCVSRLDNIASFVTKSKENQITLTTNTEQGSAESFFEDTNIETLFNRKSTNCSTMKRTNCFSLVHMQKKIRTEAKDYGQLNKQNENKSEKSAPVILQQYVSNSQLLLEEQKMNERKKYLTDYYKQKCSIMKNKKT